jgi:hypothetical protein
MCNCAYTAYFEFQVMIYFFKHNTQYTNSSANKHIAAAREGLGPAHCSVLSHCYYACLSTRHLLSAL